MDTTSPTIERIATIRTPETTVWVAGANPLIHPAGPADGFMIQAVIRVAATPPTMMARTC